MSRVPKLIFINGPVSSGKTTLAQRYIDEHRMALHLNIDDFVGALGQWLDHEDEARTIAFGYLTAIAAKHLAAGYDVVVPFLLVRPEEAAAIERLTRDNQAEFYEFVLMLPREEAVKRAIARGTWGEPGSPPLTADDRPIVEKLYDSVVASLKQRPNAVKLVPVYGQEDATYRELLGHLTDS